MNREVPLHASTLSSLAIAVVDRLIDRGDGRQAHQLRSMALAEAVVALRVGPAAPDRGFVRLAGALGLSDAEIMTTALVAASEEDAATAHAVAEAQAPVGGARPLVGLAARAFAELGATPLRLVSGRAAASGLLRFGEPERVLPERPLSIPLPVLATLRGQAMNLPGSCIVDAHPQPVPFTTGQEIRRIARSLSECHVAGAILRSVSVQESLAVAAMIAQSLGCCLAWIDGAPDPATAPWLIAREALPVFVANSAPGERWKPPEIHHHVGPVLIAAGPETIVETDRPFEDWRIPVPSMAERRMLWIANGMDGDTAVRAATSLRQGAGRIHQLSRLAAALAHGHGREGPGWSDLAEAVARGSPALGVHARLSVGTVDSDALILPERLRRAMHDLLDRARVRDRLQTGLGPAVTARYRPGVRGLFVGESGTGKTLAAHWFASQLGLPLYRVDLGALSSKWIGETEKNISEVLGAAEDADAVLFFDEADALFAARTDVADANDRHANAQTNHLLQRIEEFDGIAILAANSRTRFDPAFVRRLDAILDFPMPEGAARAALWRAHLGGGHGLNDHEIDGLAVGVDLTGGHIRNIALAAASVAMADGTQITFAHIRHAVAEEYGKLGKPAPGLGP